MNQDIAEDRNGSQGLLEMSERMLDVDVGAVLDLGKVTSNGNHVLRAIKIRNHGEGPMLVHLSSDRPQEISFQLHNDNLPDSDSSSSASLGAENDFNQLFNTIGIIHELQIPARSEQRVVLTYLPARYDWENQDDALSSKQTIIGGQRDAVSLTSSKSVIGPVSGTVNSPVSVSGTLNFTGKILGGGSTEGGEIHTCSVRLLAQVCKSVLALQPTEIMLSSCVPGGIYYRDFTLLNLSNIPLYFSMILSPATSQAVANKTLKLSEVDQDEGETGDGILRNGCLPAGQRMRVGVTFTPESIGDMMFEARFDNLNDESNSETVRMLAVVSNETMEDGLEVFVRPWHEVGSALPPDEDDVQAMRGRDAVIDFGNCFTGVGQRKIMLLKNTAKRRLNVLFATDSDGDDVRFGLHTDLHDSDDEDDDVRPGILSSHIPSEEGAAVSAGGEGDRQTNSDPSAGPSSTAAAPAGEGNARAKLELVHEGSTHSMTKNEEENVRKAAGTKRGIDYFRDAGDEVEARHGRIEEVDLGPGQERSIVVWYCPSIKSAAGQSAGDTKAPGVCFDKNLASLSSRSFHVILKVVIPPSETTIDRLESVHAPVASNLQVHSRKVILGKAKVCSSFIEVSPEIHLGDCTIGTSKKGDLRVTNLSELPCKVALRFSSKILKVIDPSLAEQCTIAPRSSHTYQLEITPMRINPGYCKQITVENLSNRANDQYVNVRSNNVDSNRVSLHSLFYLVRSKHPSNSIYFDTLVTNSPMIRTFTLKNITDSVVTLELSPSEDYIKVYREGDGTERVSTIYNIESFQSATVSSSSSSSSSFKPLPPDLPDRSEGQATPRASRKLMRSVEEEDGTSFHALYPLNVGAAAAPSTPRQLGERKRSKSLEPPPSGAREGGPAPPSTQQDSKQITLEPSSSVTGRPAERAPKTPSKREVRPHQPKMSHSHRTGERRNSRVTWESLKERYENSSFFAMATRYFNTALEEQVYIEQYNSLKADLDKVIKDGILSPVRRISIPARESCNLVAVLTAPNRVTEGDSRQVGKIRRMDKAIKIKLIEYDQELLDRAMYHRGRLVTYTPDVSQEIPERILPITAKVCRSIMEVAQRHINFGTVLAKNDYAKKLIIKNLSDVPLMYEIVKNNNWVSSAFMNFEGMEGMGVVKPHGQHEKDFVFTPKISGKFHEVLRIKNLQDPENQVEVTVKALVRKRNTFSLLPNSLDFGRCINGERTRMCRIEVRNETSSSRTVTIKHGNLVLKSADETKQVPLPDGALQVHYVLEKCTVVHEKVNKEEELERMERKLRIYIRKGKHGKAEKLKEKISALQGKPLPDPAPGSATEGSRNPSPSPENSDESVSGASVFTESDYSSDDQSDAEDSEWQRRQMKSELPHKSGQCMVILPGKGLQTILLNLSIGEISQAGELLSSFGSQRTIRGQLIAHETANRDSHKIIEFSAQWVLEQEVSSAAGSEASTLLHTINVPSLRPATTPLPSTKAAPSHELEVEGLTRSGTLTAEQVRAARTARPSHSRMIGSALEVRPSFVEMNEVYVGEIFEGSFEIHNRSSAALGYLVMNPSGKKKEQHKEKPGALNVEEVEGRMRAAGSSRGETFKFSCQHGKLDPGASQTISFTCIPDQTGRQTHTIMVRNITQTADSTVMVSFSGRKRGKESSSYLKFPQCQEWDNGVLGMDFGECYIAPKGTTHKNRYLKTVEMKIVSVHETDSVLLSIRSNLANQILIFSDKDLSLPAENIHLLPKHEITVWICILAPVEGKKESSKWDTVGFGATTLWDEYNKGVSRELVVGITVDLVDPETRESIVQQGFQMKGRIGKSIMKLSTKFIDLGTSRNLGNTMKASFTVSNHSDHLPLRFAVSPPAGVHVSYRRSELDGRKKRLTKELFSKLDVRGDGLISVAELEQEFSELSSLLERCEDLQDKKLVDYQDYERLMKEEEGKSVEVVEIVYKCSEFGLFLEPLIVANLSANQFWSSHEEKQEILILHFAEEGVIQSDSPPPASFFSVIDSTISLLSVWKTYDVDKTQSMFIESFNDKGKWPCLNMRCNYVVPGYVDLLLNPPLLNGQVGFGAGSAYSEGYSSGTPNKIAIFDSGRGSYNSLPDSSPSSGATSPVSSSSRRVTAALQGQKRPESRSATGSFSLSQSFNQTASLLTVENLPHSDTEKALSPSLSSSPTQAVAGSPSAVSGSTTPPLSSSQQPIRSVLPGMGGIESTDFIELFKPKEANLQPYIDEIILAQAQGIQISAIVLKNTTSQAITLRPLSSLRLIVQAGSVPNIIPELNEQVRSSQARKLSLEASQLLSLEGAESETSNPVSVEKWAIKAGWDANPVGQPFTIPSNDSVILYVAMIPSPENVSLSSTDAQVSACWVEMLEKLKTGARVPFEAPLLFECDRKSLGCASTGYSSNRSNFIVHRIMLSGCWGQPLARHVSPAGVFVGEPQLIDLGKIGHVNQWNAVPFSLKIANSADVPLLIESKASKFSGPGFDYPKTMHEIVFLSSSSDRQEELSSCYNQIDPLEQGIVQGLFKPAMVNEGGLCQFDITVSNVHNPFNSLTFVLTARVIASTLLHFTGRQLISEGQVKEGGFQLTMPELVIPSPREAKSSELITVTNINDEPLELHAYVEIEESVLNLLTVDILSSSTSTHVESFSLNPAQSMQIVVVCKCKEGLFKVPEGLKDRGKIALAKILFQSPSLPTEQVLVLGSLAQGSTISVDCERLSLTWKLETLQDPKISLRGEQDETWQSTSLLLTSLSGSGVPYEVKPRLIQGMDSSMVRIEPSSGFLSGYESLTMRLAVAPPLDKNGTIRVPPGQLELIIKDTRFEDIQDDGNAAGFRRIIVNFYVEGSNGGDTPKSKTSNFANLPTLALRGVNQCRSGDEAQGDGREMQKDLSDVSSSPVLGTLFEVNAGKLNYQDRDSEITLLLEYVGPQKGPIRYEVFIPKEDASWLQVKNTSGTLEHKGDTYPLRFNLTTSRMGVYSTYMWIDNLLNPLDRKTIRVSMEVVGNHKTPQHGTSTSESSPWFSILTSGFGDEREDGMKDSAKPPCINLGHVFYGQLYRSRSFLIRNDSEMPLDFTISSNVDSHSATEVNFSSTHHILKSLRLLSLQPQTTSRVFVFYRPGRQSANNSTVVEDAEDGLGNDGTGESFEVYVRCRLVKDHQRVIRFTARCFEPKLNLQRETALLFSPSRPYLNQHIGNREMAETLTGSVTEVNAVLEVMDFFPLCYLVPIRASGESDVNVTVCNDTHLFESFLLQLPPERAGRQLQEKVVAADAELSAEVDAMLKEQEVLTAVGRVKPNIKALQPACCYHLVVRLKPQALAQRTHSLMKHRYAQESITVYNRKNLAEIYTINLNIASGHIKNFVVPPGSKACHSYFSIERSIMTFIVHYQNLWHQTCNEPNRREKSLGEADWATLQSQTSMSGSVEEEEEAAALLAAGIPIASKKANMTEQNILTISSISDFFADHPDFPRLGFLLHSIVDDMVSFGVRDQSRVIFQLVNLLFTSLFRHETFADFIAFGSQLRSREKRKLLRRPWSLRSGGSEGSLADGEQASKEADAEGAAQAGAIETGSVGLVLLPRPQVAILQQLQYLLSFFPGCSDTIPELRKAMQDLIRLLPTGLPWRDSRQYSESFAPMPECI